MSTQSDPLKVTAQELPIFVIAGDSWACGEWEVRNQKLSVSHQGLAHFLQEDGYEILQVAAPGASLNDTLIQVKQASKILSCIDSRPVTVLVFQTEWHRDLSPPNECAPINISFETFTPETIENLINQWSQNLSLLAQECNFTIGLIGGCSDTMYCPEFKQRYPGVHVICQSMVSLCTTGNDRIKNPTYGMIYNEKFISILKKMCSQQGLEFLIEQLTKAENRKKLLESYAQAKWFRPDQNHANRHAHHRLFQFLKCNNYV